MSNLLDIWKSYVYDNQSEKGGFERQELSIEWGYQIRCDQM